ncbi:hypothetical protein PRIPAC_72668 [Pristionchus pacificus]|uniref:Uncharacterized protein n=1 Tax=Pristionchus pacificus TaxID=54126 RepID=A0A2A6BWJ3_PRIPA|nr:hypothetical protein PRIPAC_72668 [Pristionchus pacificus]|eukprot:PDM70206.1 hypothetical protein PRIPAC_45510 [Pristionchus pacificus]
MAVSLNAIILLIYVKFFRNYRLKIENNEIRRLNEQCEMYKIEGEKWKIDNIRLQNAYDELKKVCEWSIIYGYRIFNSSTRIAHEICGERQGETIIEYPSPQAIEKSPDVPLIPFDPENPIYDI